MNVNGNTKKSSTVIGWVGAGVLAMGAAAAVFGAGSASASPVPGNPSGYHSDHVVTPNQNLGPQGFGGPQVGGPQGHGTVFAPGSALQPGNVSDDARDSRNAGPNAATPLDSGDHPRSNPGFDSPLPPV